MYATKRCFVVGIPAGIEWVFNVTTNGLSGGAFRARKMSDKICIMDHLFKSNSEDKEFEDEIFKEVFNGLLEKEKLPVYFNAKLISERAKQLLKEMGAVEMPEINHAWPNEVNIVKLEVKKQ